MTPLRQRLIREMQPRPLAPGTINAYIAAVAGLAKFYPPTSSSSKRSGPISITC